MTTTTARRTGLLNGVEFTAPRELSPRVPFEAFLKIHPGTFGPVVVMQLFRRGILTQICGNNFLVLKVAPPLMIGEREADEFVDAITRGGRDDASRGNVLDRGARHCAPRGRYLSGYLT